MLQPALARPPTNHSHKLLTDQQAAALVGLSRETIRRWGELGKFPKPRHQHKNYTRFHIDDLEAWIDGTWTPPKNKQR